MQHVLCRDSFLTDTGISKSHVLRKIRVQVVAHHNHVEVLVHGVNGVRQRGVSGRRQHIRQTRNLQNIGGVATASALSVEGVNDPVLECRNGVVSKPALIQSVRVDCHLDIHLIGYVQGLVNNICSCAPVLVNL